MRREYLYAISYMAMRATGWGGAAAAHNVGYAVAVSDDEARAIGLRWSHESHPSSDGWTNHHVAVLVVRDQTIQRMAHEISLQPKESA